MKTAKDIIKELPSNINDIARLTAEAAEELGERTQGLTRVEMLHLLRRVIRAGVAAVKAEEHTVSFEKAAWASVESRAGRGRRRCGICGILCGGCCGWKV